MAIILKAENLEKIYRVGKVDVPALRGVSLAAQEGEFVAVMGPSGCGKSTMLHLLGGLLTPTRGRIVVDGEDLTAASDARRTDIRRRKIGFVFQRFNLFPTLTAEGNLRLAERIHGNGADDPARRREILRMLRLEDKMHHKPLELSGGEQQRVARSEEHTSELQSQSNLVCRLLLEKKKNWSIRKRLPRCKMRLKKRLLAFSRRLHARIRKTRYMHKMRCLLINRRSLLLALRLLWKTPIFPSNSRFPRLCAKCLLKLKLFFSILPTTK